MTDIDILLPALRKREPRAIARAISLVEDGSEHSDAILSSLDEAQVAEAVVLGITGPPGAGKSTLTNQLITAYRSRGRRIGIIAVDPSSPISGGALLGDRIRMMQHAVDPDVIVRSMATRGRLGGLCAAAGAVVRILAGTGCSPIIIETVGVGQSEMDIIRLADITALVLAPGLGDDIQAMKAGLLEVADILVVNKADNPGAETLAMDLESAGRQRDRQAAVCLTVAPQGIGIDALLERISATDTAHRQSGERTRRRREAYRLEVLDWCVELLRPELMEKIITSDFKQQGDPRVRAKKILADMHPGKNS